MQIFAAFIHPEHRTGNEDQLDQRPEAESLGLEDALQEGQVDHAGLAGQGAKNSVIEHLVSEQRHFTAQDGLTLAAAAQCVEHVEENEAGECHGGVVRGDDAGALLDWAAVGDIAHLVDVD